MQAFAIFVRRVVISFWVFIMVGLNGTLVPFTKKYPLVCRLLQKVTLLHALTRPGMLGPGALT